MAKRASSKKKKKMAKRPSSKKKGFRAAMQALGGVNINTHDIGRVAEDGEARIDYEQLEKLKEKLGEGAWRKVRFVALNAPFKRRSPIAPT
jgi:hypothetical protein